MPRVEGSVLRRCIARQVIAGTQDGGDSGQNSGDGTYLSKQETGWGWCPGR